MDDLPVTQTPKQEPSSDYWNRLGTRLSDTWPLFLCGLGIGMLTGLSIAPGISATVISVVLCLTAALAAVFSGFRPLPPGKLDPVPTTPLSGLSAILAGVRVSGPNAIGIMLLIVGVSIGACTGIYFRTHNTLGVESSLTNRDVATKSETAPQEARVQLAGKSVLFNNVSPGDKERLNAVSKTNVVVVAATCQDPMIRRFAEVFKDEPDLLLKIIQEVLIWQQGSSH
jgi:hypothetical protein